MKKFAATKPVSNFILLWVLLFGSFSAFGEEGGAIFVSSYQIVWVLLIYKFLIDKEPGEYGGDDFDIWVAASITLLGVWFGLQIFHPRISDDEIYTIIDVVVRVSWGVIYIILCWRVSKLLINLYHGEYWLSSHLANFLAFYVWPGGGIFYVGDKLLR
ncbi:MAG: hypothetical protein ACLFV8_09210, partial [Alphaproteobacteria bacterium]